VRAHAGVRRCVDESRLSHAGCEQACSAQHGRGEPAHARTIRAPAMGGKLWFATHENGTFPPYVCRNAAGQRFAAACLLTPLRSNPPVAIFVSSSSALLSSSKVSLSIEA